MTETYRLFGVFECWSIVGFSSHREARQAIRWPFRWLFAVEWGETREEAGGSS